MFDDMSSLTRRSMRITSKGNFTRPYLCSCKTHPRCLRVTQNERENMKLQKNRRHTISETSQTKIMHQSQTNKNSLSSLLCQVPGLKHHVSRLVIIAASNQLVNVSLIYVP